VSRTTPTAGGVPSRAWDFDPATGNIDKRRVFVRIATADGVPDGATVDSEGFVWIPLGRLAHRPLRSRRSRRPDDHAAGCAACPMFGGPCLDIIFVISASISARRRARRSRRPAFAIKGGVKRLPEARFRG